MLRRKPQEQPNLTSFFPIKDVKRSTNGAETRRNGSRMAVKRQRLGVTKTATAGGRDNASASSFGSCLLCEQRLPLHHLEAHAASCDGANHKKHNNKNKASSSDSSLQQQPIGEPIPGLFLYENFITPEEEAQILAQLDGTDLQVEAEYLPWKAATFNGTHCGKRWGVHCNLRDRRVGAAEHPLPHFIQHILLPKLKDLAPMKGCTPNEANAIDYRKGMGHYLAAHVDDRQLSKEPIANVSLAGDCYMTFTNVATHRNAAVACHKVLLRRRCLQILTGKARYDFSHAIAPGDMLSDRRVSVTMRESPLTKTMTTTTTTKSSTAQISTTTKWWEAPKAKIERDVRSSPQSPIRPTSEPLPGLMIFPNFITEEEEAMIIQELDNVKQQAWKVQRHSGLHREKRFGVDYDLWSREVRAPKHALPDWIATIVIPKLKRIATLHDFTPNDANALEYHRQLGHWLKDHVDDRKKHKEPIANLSLVGDCYMKFRNTQSRNRNLAVPEKKVLLQRRSLQVMTGSARYDFSHGIQNSDLLSDRRVSVTVRETPWPSLS